MTEYSPIHFFDEQIEVQFDTPPVYEKTPPCPNGFIWNDETYRIIETLSEIADSFPEGSEKPAPLEAVEESLASLVRELFPYYRKLAAIAQQNANVSARSVPALVRTQEEVL